MLTSTDRPPAVKPEHRFYLTALPLGLTGLGITTVSRGRARDDFYFVERIEGCDDLAYQLVKMDPALDGTDKEAECYAVNLTTRTCDCKGWHRWTHCKHLDAITAVYEEGGLS